MIQQIENVSTSEWWRQRRLSYNVGLAAAGLLAFITYVSIVFAYEDRIEDVDITVFTTAFQAIGYLLAMGVANIFYYLGPLSERLLNPRNATKYRNVTFNLGFWFSVLLPFSIPTLVAYSVIKKG